MPATAKSQGMRLPVAVTKASTRSAPSKAVTWSPGPQLDPLRAVDGADLRADLPTQHRLERCLAREDRGHLDPELGQRRRYLAADEPHAHDDRVPPGTASALIASHSATVRR